MTLIEEPAVRVLRADQRFATRTVWLDSHHCFSFGAHYDPDNTAHGALMVINDEVVRSGTGFDTHPHRDAEIVTWVLSGSLVHEDSRGNSGIIYPGLAQRMTAGSGIRHSERNDAFRIDPERAAEPVRFVQMWLRPDTPDADPSYAQREVDLTDLPGGWLPVASGGHPDAAVSLGNAGSTLWVSTLGAGVARTLPEAPFVHLYVAEGAVDCETVGRLGPGDSLRLTGAAALRLTGRSTTPAEVLVWEMAG